MGVTGLSYEKSGAEGGKRLLVFHRRVTENPMKSAVKLKSSPRAAFKSRFTCVIDPDCVFQLQQILRTLQQGGALQAGTAKTANTENAALTPPPAQENSSISKVTRLLIMLSSLLMRKFSV